MYLNTLENTFPKNKKSYTQKKLGEYNLDNAKMVINFYASLKTVIALSISVVDKRKKIGGFCQIDSDCLSLYLLVWLFYNHFLFYNK